MTAPTAKLFPRFATDRVTTALEDTPVVMVNGPRQCGKTTLVRESENTVPFGDNMFAAPISCVWG